MHKEGKKDRKKDRKNEMKKIKINRPLRLLTLLHGPVNHDPVSHGLRV